MKKNLFIILLLSFCSWQVKSQIYTPNAMLDSLSDRFGTKYSLNEIKIPINPADRAASVTCGYFDLYFEVGSGFETFGDPIHDQRRAVLCQVLNDLSDFIVPGDPTVKVNIWVRDLLLIGGGSGTSCPNPLLGAATSLYTVPSGTTINGPSIVDGEMWKTINSGTDSYTNEVFPLSAYGFYHGIMAFNFCSGTNWHTDLTLPTATGTYDLYTIILHEVTHALGFASLINELGGSKIGNNYFGRYDLFLQKGGLPLILNSGSCSLYDYQFNSALPSNTVVGGGVPGCINLGAPIDNTDCTTGAVTFAGTANQAVYTPNCFEPPSSLSHFEDQCPSGLHINNEYFVMSNVNNSGPAFMKRFLKQEERNALCDMRYKTNATYGSAVNLNFVNYGATCGTLVAGINDGIDITSGAFIYPVATGGNVTILHADLLLNDNFDLPGGATIECVQELYGLGTLVTAGTTTTFTAGATSGITLLRYIPVDGSGNRGNVTYVFVIVTSGGCPPTACNLIPNGNFENVNAECGGVAENCWVTLSQTPDVYGRLCTSPLFDIPLPPTFYTYIGGMDDYTNNTPPNVNNHFVGIVGGQPCSGSAIESIQIQSAPILPNTNYTLSFWSYTALPTSGVPYDGTIEISGMESAVPVAAFSYFSAMPNNVVLVPAGAIVIPPGSWTYHSVVFSHTNLLPLNNFIVSANGLVGTCDQPYILIDDIQVNPSNPAVTLTLPSNICFGQDLVDIVTYASLQAPPPSGIFSGPGVTLAGTIYSFNSATAGVGSHTISYTYTDISGCVTTVTNVITVDPTASVDPVSNITICAGEIVPASFFTVTPSGSPFDWTNSNTAIGLPANGIGNVPSFTATNATGSPIIGTISVTATLGSCAGTPMIYTITVNPTPSSPTLTVITSSPICSGTTAVINSSSMSNWYDAPIGGTLLASGASSYTTPGLGSSTTYYVSAVIGTCESPRVAVTVNVVACCSAPNTLASSYSTNTTINALGTFYTASALNTVVSAGTLTLNSMNLQMFPNYKITVNSGATLILSGTNIWACTDYMWDGIDVLPGGKVIMNTNSAIEDAKIAVHLLNASLTEAKFDISKTTFNKNHKSIVVEPYSVPHTGIVHTSLFTSAASTFPQLGILGGATTLKNPFNTVPARTANIGVEIQNVKAITIGSGLGQNTFNNLEVGIHSSQNTTLTSYNNKFQNIRYGKTCTAAVASCYLASTTGMGIWAEKTGTIVVGGAGSLSNKFNLSDNGIVAHNDINVDVQNCTFTNILPPITALRSRCIYIFSENNPQIITIKDNTFKDFMIGTEINSYFSCQVNIFNNDFKKFNTGVGVLCLQNVKSTLNVEFNHFNNSAADFGYNAIRVQNAVVPTNGSTTIYQNDIVNCTIGIKCTKIGKAQIDNINSVKFNLPTAPSVAHFGIWIENGLSNNINNNLVYKTGTTAGASYTNLLYGYAIDDVSFGSIVTNNRAQLLNSGYRFKGFSNNPITYGCNFITKNYTGLELNGTDIGDQGFDPTTSPPDGAAQDNQWVYATVSGFPFGVRNIGSVIPTFYSRSSATLWFPNSFQQSPPVSIALGTPIVSSSPYNCTYGCADPPCFHSPIAKIAKKEAPYNAMSIDNIDLTNTTVYQLLKEDSLIYSQGLPDDSVIVNYKDSLAFTNVGTLYDVSDKIMLFDSVTAKTKNDGIIPKNCKEQSQKIVNDIYLRSWAKGIFEFTPPDSALLQTIADFTVSECGLAVFDARVMLRIDKNDYLVDESRMAFQNNEIYADPYGLMYPNPANTIAYYEIELENEQTGFIQLFDVLGNLVVSQKLSSGINKAEFDLTYLSNGIYVYKVTINNEYKTSNKLIIAK